MKAELTLEELSQALRQAGGLIGPTSRALGVPYNTIASRVKNNPELRKIIEDTREDLIDKAESKLVEQVEAGSQKAVFYVLSTLGRYRGYVKREEVVEGSANVGDDNLDFSKLSIEELKTLHILMEKAKRLSESDQTGTA